MLRPSTSLSAEREAAALAIDALRAQPARSTLAILGVVIGIVTVVIVASTIWTPAGTLTVCASRSPAKVMAPRPVPVIGRPIMQVSLG